MTGEKATAPNWLKWIHRAGYITTPIVIALLVWVLSVLIPEYMRMREGDADAIAASRTTTGPLLANGDPHVRGGLLSILDQLPPLAEVGPNGLRFVALPSFGYAEYGLKLRQDSQQGAILGTLYIFGREVEGEAESSVNRVDFEVDAASARSFLEQFDAKIDGYAGDSEYMCLDGSPMGFERVNNGRIWSGEGNCEPHYDELRTMVLELVRRHVRSSMLPTEDDWHRETPLT